MRCGRAFWREASEANKHEWTRLVSSSIDNNEKEEKDLHKCWQRWLYLIGRIAVEFCPWRADNDSKQSSTRNGCNQVKFDYSARFTDADVRSSLMQVQVFGGTEWTWCLQKSPDVRSFFVDKSVDLTSGIHCIGFPSKRRLLSSVKEQELLSSCMLCSSSLSRENRYCTSEAALKERKILNKKWEGRINEGTLKIGDFPDEQLNERRRT